MKVSGLCSYSFLWPPRKTLLPFSLLPFPSSWDNLIPILISYFLWTKHPWKPEVWKNTISEKDNRLSWLYCLQIILVQSMGFSGKKTWVPMFYELHASWQLWGVLTLLVFRFPIFRMDKGHDTQTSTCMGITWRARVSAPGICWVFDSEIPGWGLRICISNLLPHDSDSVLRVLPCDL